MPEVIRSFPTAIIFPLGLFRCKYVDKATVHPCTTSPVSPCTIVSRPPPHQNMYYNLLFPMTTSSYLPSKPTTVSGRTSCATVTMHALQSPMHALQSPCITNVPMCVLQSPCMYYCNSLPFITVPCTTVSPCTASPMYYSFKIVFGFEPSFVRASSRTVVWFEGFLIMASIAGRNISLVL